MSFYKTCPHCGAHLDPGESCDCTISQVCTEARAVLPERAEMKEAPADAANTGEGGIVNMERKGERSREEALSELTNKIMSFTADELDEFIRLASQALNQPLV